MVKGFSFFVASRAETVIHDSFRDEFEFDNESIMKNTSNEMSLFWWNLCFPKVFPNLGLFVSSTSLSLWGIAIIAIHLSIIPRLDRADAIICTSPANNVIIHKVLYVGEFG
ncbi:hypothetical protein QL285_047673 [Trifolium repens]|nr:hypothetical protein QL285_047673 [Trifolium repens]